MSIRKIQFVTSPAGAYAIPPCAHADHEPKCSGLEIGDYEHRCDGCGQLTFFRVLAGNDAWLTLRTTGQET